MSPLRFGGIRQRLWTWISNAVVAMGAAVVAIGLFVGVAAAHRAAACDGVDCVAEGIGRSAHDTGVALSEGAATAGRALSSGAHGLLRVAFRASVQEKEYGWSRPSIRPGWDGRQPSFLRVRALDEGVSMAANIANQPK